jgi:signal transduction histidine kinase
MEGEVVLLRCAQEALANVRNHAGAASVTIDLRRVDDMIELVVQDDGVGFDPAADSTGFGIAGMRERLALAGGELSICSPETGGTLVLARLGAAG